MYTEVKSYQYIISLLKKYGVKQCVLSAGSRNVPFVHSVEEDKDFICYSVVDERSAGYFALGLAQELNEPVVISCTSSTATCNYWPAVAEAYYQNVPLIVLTSDRDQRMVGQWEDQLIDQVGMYDRHVRKSVNLPIIHDRNDEIYCQRLINEALLELNHNGAKGPIHINIPTDTYNRSFIVKNLPPTQKIDRLFINDLSNWEEKINKINSFKKILVVCGQKSNVTPKLEKELENFFEKYNCVITGDYMSNVKMQGIINTTVSMDTNVVSGKSVEKLMPDLVISFGGQIFSGIKEQLKKNCGKFEHWVIQEDGKVVDPFKSLTTVFECSPEEMLAIFNKNAKHNNTKEYYNDFKEYNDSIILPPFEYSNVYAIKNVVENLPDNSILHLSINDSIRITNFFKIPESTKVYANIGTHGIDGCMSSFLGQSVASGKPSFLVIGDLSFFYDMNSLRINSIGNNVHILLVNNHGGSEFYYNKIQQGNDKHTTARHNNIAEGWVKDNGFIYLSAHNKEEFDDNLNAFMSNNSKPVLFEVFTEMKTDAEAIHNFYNKAKPKDIKSDIIRKSKDFIKKKVGQERVKKIINALKNRSNDNMEQIRVLHVVANMQRGGIENFIMNMYRNIDRDKIQFDFLVHYQKRFDFDDEIEKMGGKIYRLSFREDNNIVKYIKDLDNFFKNHKEYKIVHGHMGSLGYFYLKAAFKNNVPIRIMHSHGSSYMKNIKGYIKRYLFNYCGKYANVKFACSDGAGRFLFNNSDYTIIPNAIDTDNFKFSKTVRNNLRKKYLINDDCKVIGHVGRFGIEKNHDFIIELFKKYNEINNNSLLLLVGDGELRNKIENKVKTYGLEKNVIFTGSISNVFDYYNMMDVFILPSLYEGLPVTGVEAQANGLPLILADNLTKEIELTNLISYISVNNIDEWIEVINNTKVDIKERESYYTEISSSIYNIKKLVELMSTKYEDYYKKGIENESKN